MTLEQIAAKHPTDKLGTHSYLPIYERLFAPLKDTRFPVLEIGVDGGGSLCIWQEWFTNAQIHGFDLNVKPPHIDGRMYIYHWQGDAYSQEGFTQAGKIGPFSIIIDDGPHSIESQRSFCSYYPRILTPDGIAIVEDIQDFSQAADLANYLPPGFHNAVIDLRHVKGRYDDVLFVAWRK